MHSTKCTVSLPLIGPSALEILRSTHKVCFSPFEASEDSKARENKKTLSIEAKPLM